MIRNIEGFRNVLNLAIYNGVVYFIGYFEKLFICELPNKNINCVTSFLSTKHTPYSANVLKKVSKFEDCSYSLYTEDEKVYLSVRGDNKNYNIILGKKDYDYNEQLSYKFTSANKKDLGMALEDRIDVKEFSKALNQEIENSNSARYKKIIRKNLNYRIKKKGNHEVIIRSYIANKGQKDYERCYFHITQDKNEWFIYDIDACEFLIRYLLNKKSLTNHVNNDTIESEQTKTSKNMTPQRIFTKLTKISKKHDISLPVESSQEEIQKFLRSLEGLNEFNFLFDAVGLSRIVESIKQHFTEQENLKESREQEVMDQELQIKQQLESLEQAKLNLIATINYCKLGKSDKQAIDNLNSALQLINQDIEELQRKLDPRPALEQDILQVKQVIQQVANRLVNDTLETEKFIELSEDICNFKSSLVDLNNQLIELNKQYDQAKKDTQQEISKKVDQQLENSNIDLSSFAHGTSNELNDPEYQAMIKDQTPKKEIAIDRHSAKDQKTATVQETKQQQYIYPNQSELFDSKGNGKKIILDGKYPCYFPLNTKKIDTDIPKINEFISNRHGHLTTMQLKKLAQLGYGALNNGENWVLIQQPEDLAQYGFDISYEVK